MEIEAGIPPLNIRLDDIARRYVLILRSLPEEHPLSCLISTRHLEKTVVTRTNQLEIGYAATQDSWPSNVEQIDYRKTKAWNPKPFYKVFISNNSKADEAIAHRSMIDSDRGTKTLYIYRCFWCATIERNRNRNGCVQYV